MSTEFFCLEQRSMTQRLKLKKLDMLAGYDMFGFYKQCSAIQGYLRLNRDVKRRYVDEMEEEAAKHGLRFYVSDAHFKERCANGSCCGLPESWNYNRGQWCHALQIAKQTGEVGWDDIGSHLDFTKGFLWRFASGFNQGCSEARADWFRHTMFDYLRWVWNNPTSHKGVYHQYAGILIPDRLDGAGNVVYRYNEEVM